MNGFHSVKAVKSVKTDHTSAGAAAMWISVTSWRSKTDR
jgi:hypothetical protein